MQTNRILKSPVDQVKEIPKISVGKLFFDGIKQHGDRVCLVAGVSDERLTFRQILEKSVKLAVALKRLGLKRNDVISLVSENHIEAYIPYLASLYNGIILNVLNPDYTKYELQISLERLCPKYVFCTNSALQKLQQLKPNFPTLQSIVLIGSSVDEGTIHLENLINVGETDISNYQPEEFDPNEQIAMTYNSSGTTGLPKNVLLTHSNVRTVLIQCGPYATDAKPEDIFVHTLPFFSIISLIEICCSFIYGAKTVVLSRFRPDTLMSAVERHKPTKMFLVPYLVMFMLKSPLVAKHDLSSVRKYICGSASLSSECIKNFLKKFPNSTLHQMYGLTETSAMCIYNSNCENMSTIGKLLPEMEMKIVNDEGKALGPNETGELCFRGTGVTKGYYKNEKATREAFDEDGFLKTGDVGRYDEDGYVYIVDRIKDIITYKGFQVSPSEIESVLLMHEGVRDVGVVGMPDERTGEVAVAFVALKEGCTVSTEELHAFVAEYLSVAKHLHGGIRFVEAVSRNPLGKVDRKALRSIASK